MSRPEIGDKPEPHEDPPPDEAPGGPADRIDRDPDDFPIATPDQPQSAQVDDRAEPSKDAARPEPPKRHNDAARRQQRDCLRQSERHGGPGAIQN